MGRSFGKDVMVPIASRLDRPLYPFLLLFSLPIVTAALTLLILLNLPGCVIGDESSWEQRHAQLAFLPGVANLLPFLWLMSPTARVRGSAMVAGLIGVALFALPQVSLIFPFIEGSTVSGSQSCPGSVYVHPLYVVLVLLPAMLILWFVSTLLSTLIFFRITRGKHP